VDARMLIGLRRELAGFLREFVRPMGRAERRRWAEAYVRGLLLDGDRKSVDPMARRLEAVDRDGRGAAGPRDYEQALQQFVSQRPGDERAVRDRLTEFVARSAAPGGVLILDDTGFPKQGSRSVGVARQYSGTLGKVGNCQVAVTLRYADGRDVFALDAELHLPKSWTEAPDRLRRAGVPDGVGYRPKWEAALAMLERAAAGGVTGVVLADSAYGSVTEFRDALDRAGRTWCLGVDSVLKVVGADDDLGPVPEWKGWGRRPSRPAGVRAGAKSLSVREWAVSHPGDFRRVTWREGTKGKLSGRFAAWRVRPAHRLSCGVAPRPACRLLAEWPERAEGPTRFFFSNLPKGASLKALVKTAKGRWWVEHSYARLKGELGLDPSRAGPGGAGTTTSRSSCWPTPSSWRDAGGALKGGRRRPEHPSGPPGDPGPPALLGRALSGLRPAPEGGPARHPRRIGAST